MARRGIFSVLRTSWGNVFRAKGRSSRRMASRGGTLWSRDPFVSATWASPGRRRGKRRTVKRRS